MDQLKERNQQVWPEPIVEPAHDLKEGMLPAPELGLSFFVFVQLVFFVTVQTTYSYITHGNIDIKKVRHNICCINIRERRDGNGMGGLWPYNKSCGVCVCVACGDRGGAEGVPWVV